MNCLLDTSVFLWAASCPEKLSEPALAAFTPENTLWLSLASAWEMAIKGDKLKLPAAAIEYVEDRAARLRIGLLPIRMRHLRRIAALPPVHKDPFDRLLVAQAQAEGLALISADRDLARYPVLVIW